MQLNLESLYQAAMQLPPEDRLGLAARLLDAAPDDLTINLDDPQLVKRLDERFADTEGAISWSDLNAEGP